MINKITQIVSLSRFKHFSSPSDDLKFSQTNLLYAFNGRGKTSIADIIYSLLKNDAGLLAKRSSRVYPGNLEITIKYGDPAAVARFSGGSWSNPPSGINCLVFDKTFVQQNIHTVSVDHDHKKKLHGLIVGAMAIDAKAAVSARRQETINVRKELGVIDSEYAALGVSSVSIGDFSKLTPIDVPKLKAEESVLQKQLEALGNPDEIKSRPGLLSQEPIGFDPVSLNNSCANTVVGASSGALEIIQRHLAAHVRGADDEGKRFVASGVRAMGDKNARHCALCGQVIGDEARKLLEALFTVFSSEYSTLQREINDSLESLRNFDIAVIFSSLVKNFEINQSRHKDWLKYVAGLTTLPIVHDIEELKNNISKIVGSLSSLLTRKSRDPSFEINQELSDFKEVLASLKKVVAEYNEAVSKINTEIDTYKVSLDVTKKQEIKERLSNIQVLLTRSSDQGRNVSDHYNAAAARLASTSQEYKDALTNFSNEQKSILERHGATINKFLEDSNAKFRLNGLAQGTHSGSTEPYLEYSIELNGGDQESQTTAAEAFGEILSEGEKNLLAFAFFWSLIQHSPLRETIAIFDDPLSSIDESWRFHLIDKLKELSNQGLLQLFILTHYEDFARVVALRIPEIKQLTIEAGGSRVGNIIVPLDIEATSKEIQFRRIDKLKRYIDDPTSAAPEHIQAEIRTILEAALKYKYYLKLSGLIGKGWLRDFIEEPAVKTFLEANGAYAILDTLCTCGGWANHDNPSAVIFNQDQATSYAQQTLDVLEML